MKGQVSPPHQPPAPPTHNLKQLQQHSAYWWLAVLLTALLGAWLLLSTRVTEHQRPGCSCPPTSMLPLPALLAAALKGDGSSSGSNSSSSNSPFNTAAARELVPRLQQQPEQATLHKRWGAPPQPPLAMSAAAAGDRLRIPRIIHHVYFPGLNDYFKLVEDLSSNTRLRWGATCLHQHPGWQHVFWDLAAARELVQTYYPGYSDMFVKINNTINQANAIRYFIMHAIGGLYLDMDVECFRSVEPFLADAEVVLQATPGGVTNGLLAGVPGHRIWEVAIEKIFANWQRTPIMTAGSQGGMTGPILMTNALAALKPPLNTVPNGGPYAGRHRLLNSTVLVHAKGTWYVPCQYNERDCHIRLVQERALGVADLSHLAGYHRYSASWMGGNHAGVHSMQGLQAALSSAFAKGAAPMAQCKPTPCPTCTPKPCAPQPCMPQAAQVAAAKAKAAEQGGARDANAAKALAPVRYRSLIGRILEGQKFQTGAELGVQMGVYSEQILKAWPSCTRYYLVDLWGHQENYNDGANVADAEQERRFQETRRRLAPWSSKTVFFRNYTTQAAKQIPDDSLDFIYVDARHDYCGVKADLAAYWPKLRSGGILAGHDYVDAVEIRARNPRNPQDWSLCADGTRHDGAVRGAVNEFAIQHGLTIAVTYGEPDFPSWMARKP